ncbi:lactate racemase domain-containing protein [Rubinisphaera margarita]|uniref:lactate racemase domain-containing protein n=1 Tax=Rubinisphaera margarita TaxID=2909586 RepID=UPI001EE8D439|nr:lactate racemase domain-containing protein [Rubinisphaera margarita]MCG6156780.1 lactate racemase domain-containing protein [Rubinisphaera margarita]
MAQFEIHYGTGESFQFELPEEHVLWKQSGPEAQDDAVRAIEEALATPLDYPPVGDAVVPGDKVTLVIDAGTPAWDEIIRALGRQLESRGVEADKLHVVLNGVGTETAAAESSSLPYKVIAFDEAMQGRSVYLASTAEGQRIYLPEEIGEADYVVTIGRFGFDDRWGYRGTNSTVYPAFGGEEAQTRFSGPGSQELSPDESFGVRQMIDEIGWLLGLQFSVQVIPSGSGKLAHVIAGASDSVYRESVSRLNSSWRSSISTPAETVIVSVPSLEAGDAWFSTARACRAAEKLVSEDGRVLLVTDLKDFPEGLQETIQSSGDSDEVMRNLNRSKSPASRAVATLAGLASRYRVYLLSRLEQDIVENLFCIPLADTDELRSALQGGTTYAVLDGGQFAWVDTEN